MKKIHANSEANREFDVLKAYDAWNTLEDALEEPTQKFQQQMKILYNQRCNDIEFCERELKKAEAKAEKECVLEIRKFISYRKKMRLWIESKTEEDRGEEEYGQTLKDECDQLENRLMHIEMSLRQKLNEGTDIFNAKVQSNYQQSKDIANQFFEEAGGYVDNYNNELRAFALDAADRMVAEIELKLAN